MDDGERGQGRAGTFWADWRVGERVVVRHRLDVGLSDALGYLTAVGENGVTVRTRRGEVAVAAGAMLTGKRVPPPPDLQRWAARRGHQVPESAVRLGHRTPPGAADETAAARQEAGGEPAQTPGEGSET